jgi:hypothetical protein
MFRLVRIQWGAIVLFVTTYCKKMFYLLSKFVSKCNCDWILSEHAVSWSHVMSSSSSFLDFSFCVQTNHPQWGDQAYFSFLSSDFYWRRSLKPKQRFSQKYSYSFIGKLFSDEMKHLVIYHSEWKGLVLGLFVVILCNQNPFCRAYFSDVR